MPEAADSATPVVLAMLAEEVMVTGFWPALVSVTPVG